MRNISPAFDRALLNDRRDYKNRLVITFANDTVIEIDNSRLWDGGFQIEDSVSADNSFQIGAAIINQGTFIINNIYGEYDRYNFDGASIVAYTGMEGLDDGTNEEIRMGTFIVDEARYNGSLITLVCVDYMSEFDKAYDTQLVYPATLSEIVLDACTKCGVSYAPNYLDFPHKDYVVTTKPSEENTTYRQVISWAAQIAGCFARFNSEGKLELKWFDTSELDNFRYRLDGGVFDNGSEETYVSGDDADGGTFDPWETGEAFDGGTFTEQQDIQYLTASYTSNLSVDDIVITGTKVIKKIEAEDSGNAFVEYTCGSSGYVISIENNDFIDGEHGQDVANWLGQQIIGLTFRKAELSHPNNPSIEAGDVAIFIDDRGSYYPILISSTTFIPGDSQRTVSSAETPRRNSAQMYSEATKDYVDLRRTIKKVTNKIESIGGLYATDVPQPGGGSIIYYHDKPNLNDSEIQMVFSQTGFLLTSDKWEHSYGMTVDGEMLASILSVSGVNADWINGGTLTLGGLNNINGWLKILNASGSEIGRWDNQGVQLNSGSINLANNFIVTTGGAVTAKNIDAQGGYIGGITINNSYLRHGSNVNASNWVSMCTPNAKDSDSYVGKGGLATSIMYNKSYSESSRQVLHQRLYGGQHEFRVGAYLCGGFGVNPSSSDAGTGSVLGTQFYCFDYNHDKLMYLQGSYITTYGTLRVDGTLYVTGSKSRVVDTENYSERLLYAYETASPMFGDIGEGIIGEDGLCYISIDPVFAETVVSNSYQVFLQAYGDGKCYVFERHPTFFIVKGEANMSFGWEIKARQSDYDQKRLDRNFDLNPKNSIDYVDLANEHITELREEREVY